MAKKRIAKRKTKSKGKQKVWYEVKNDDKVMPNVVVGEVLSSDPKNLINRVLRIPLSDLTGSTDPSSLYSNVKLRVYKVGSKNVSTRIIGHEVAMSYLKALARRRRTVMHHVVDVETKDNVKIRVKVMLVTQSKVSSTLRASLRRRLHELLLELPKKRYYYEFMKEILGGDLARSLFSELNKVTPLEHFEIKKSEIFEDTLPESLQVQEVVE